MRVRGTWPPEVFFRLRFAVREVPLVGVGCCLMKSCGGLDWCLETLLNTHPSSDMRENPANSVSSVGIVSAVREVSVDVGETLCCDRRMNLRT